MQVGIPVLGVVENMSGLSQQLHKFKFFTTSPDGTQQDVTQQLLQHLPAELQVTLCTSNLPFCVHSVFCYCFYCYHHYHYHYHHHHHYHYYYHYHYCCCYCYCFCFILCSAIAQQSYRWPHKIFTNLVWLHYFAVGFARTLHSLLSMRISVTDIKSYNHQCIRRIFKQGGVKQAISGLGLAKSQQPVCLSLTLDT